MPQGTGSRPGTPGLTIIPHRGEDNGFSNSNRTCRRVATGPGHRGVLRGARGLPVPAHAGAVRSPSNDRTVRQTGMVLGASLWLLVLGLARVIGV